MHVREKGGNFEIRAANALAFMDPSHLPPFQLFKIPPTTVSLNGKKVTCACLSLSLLPRPKTARAHDCGGDGRRPPACPSTARPPACRVPRMPTAARSPCSPSQTHVPNFLPRKKGRKPNPVACGAQRQSGVQGAFTLQAMKKC